MNDIPASDATTAPCDVRGAVERTSNHEQQCQLAEQQRWQRDDRARQIARQLSPRRTAARLAVYLAVAALLVAASRSLVQTPTWQVWVAAASFLLLLVPLTLAVRLIRTPSSGRRWQEPARRLLECSDDIGYVERLLRECHGQAPPEAVAEAIDQLDRAGFPAVQPEDLVHEARRQHRLHRRAEQVTARVQAADRPQGWLPRLADATFAAGVACAATQWAISGVQGLEDGLWAAAGVGSLLVAMALFVWLSARETSWLDHVEAAHIVLQAGCSEEAAAEALLQAAQRDVDPRQVAWQLRARPSPAND